MMSSGDAPRRPSRSLVDAQVGERIREARIDAGLSQRQLAARTETLTASYISRLESGERSPSQRTVAAVANALGADRRYLSSGNRRECWALFTPELNRAWGPFDNARQAMVLAQKKGIDKVLVIELESP